MSFAKEVWSTLSIIDCNDHKEVKGNGNFKLSYLSWTWAWATLMDIYPESEYSFDAPVVYENGTVEVWVTVTVKRGEDGVTRRLWLPVMDHKNNSIQNPSSRQISDSRMRCLVKCLAMFGLGHYIYAGEDIPGNLPEDSLPSFTPEQKDTFDALIAEGDDLGIVAYMARLSHEVQTSLYNSFEKGAKSSGKERVNNMTTSGVKKWDELSADIIGMIESEDQAGLLEAVSELKNYEKSHLARMIGDRHTQRLGELIEQARAA